MKKSIITMALGVLPMLASAQYTFDALQLSQTELRGTSRFMSMGGAFGALGGDISVLNQNPAGIGIYRSSDLGLTLGVDFNSAKAGGTKVDETKFNFSNVGYVGAIKLDSETMPNLNWGVSYNRNYSFNRHWRGAAFGIPTSITNYLADVANSAGVTLADLDPSDGKPFDTRAAWNQVLAYQNYLLNPNAGGTLDGLGYDGVVGDAEFEVNERGHSDEFSIALGGNLANTLYWGFSVGITDLLYEYNRYYGEVLDGTMVYDKPNDANAKLTDGNAAFGFSDWSRTTGTGYSFKLGAILKPVNALRIGLAFHTPTYYDMKDTYQSVVASEFVPDKADGYVLDDYYTPTASSWYKLRTPWRFIGSLATVIGTTGILSADYEYVSNTNILLLDDHNNEFAGAKQEAKDFLAGSHIMRVGGELRLTPNWSLRAGYSYQTSNASQDVRDYGGAHNPDGSIYPVQVGGNSTAYAYDRKVQHITAGFGYRYKNVYFDMAYVHKYRQSNYEAFPIDNDGNNVLWDVKEHNNRVTATLGFRF
ncbi:MAG: outer membrane protein transport protein [Muribaculaceae bacterium]|nr:outer membrane protein transport protein [Muribaculaceae bacterium]